MNASNKNHPEASCAEALPRLGYVEDDIRENLREVADRCVGHTLDTLEHRRRKSSEAALTTREDWRLLRARSRMLYLQIARQVLEELEESWDVHAQVVPSGKNMLE